MVPLRRLFTLLFLLIASASFSQPDSSSSRKWKPDRWAYGLGIGPENGGMIGLNLNWHPTHSLGLVGAFGYADFTMGFAGGLRLRATGKEYTKRVAPYVTGMYGLHTIVKVKGREELNKVFYGFMAGTGIEIRTGKNSNYFCVGLTLPFRGSEPDQYVDDLVKYRNAKVENKYWPLAVAFSFKSRLK